MLTGERSSAATRRLELSTFSLRLAQEFTAISDGPASYERCSSSGGLARRQAPRLPVILHRKSGHPDRSRKAPIDMPPLSGHFELPFADVTFGSPQ